MKYVKNQSGMALVVVLFLIVIFSIVGVAILNFTVTNAKQTKNIEVDMQSVDAAEMGIVKYRSELITKLDTELSADIKSAIEKIDEENAARAKRNAAKTTGQALEEYIDVNAESIIDEMMKDSDFKNPNRFLLGYNPMNVHPVFENSAEQFSIQEFPINISSASGFPQIIKIEVISKGKSLQDENEIRADFEFDLGYIINTFVEPGEVIEGEQNNNTISVQRPSIALPYLWENNLSNIQNKDISLNNKADVMDGQFQTTKGIKIGNLNSSSIENALLKAGESIEIGSIEGIYNSKIHANNKLIVPNINNGSIENTEISGFNSAEFNSTGNGISNSLIYFENMLKFNNDIKGIRESKIYSSNNLTFSNITAELIDSIIMSDDIMKLGNFNTGAKITNSTLYSKNNMTLGELNGAVTSSTIYSEDWLTIGNVNSNAPILNSTIYSKDNMSFKELNASITNSKIYSGDWLSFGILNSNATINNSSIYSKDNMTFKELNAGITNSTIYSGDWMTFGNLNNNANIKDSIIYAKDNLNFDSIGSSIQGSTVIYSNDRIYINSSFLSTDFSGNLDKTAFVCSAGNIAKGFHNKASSIPAISDVVKNKVITTNVVENVTFEQCLALAGKSLTQEDKIKTSNVNSFTDALKQSIDNADYIYK